MKILVIGELKDNVLSSDSLELISKSVEMSEEVYLCTIGDVENPNAKIDNLICKYIKTNDSTLSTHAIANLLADLINKESIEVIFLSSSYLCRDLAAFLSVDFNSAAVTNVIDIELQNTFNAITAINGGKDLYSTEIDSDKKIVVIRPKSFELKDLTITEVDQSDFLKLEDLPIDTTINEVTIEPKSGPQLEDSSIIVSAGRGLGEAENLSLVNDLANKLNAAVGATRAIVDAGWVPYSQQVGQTGKTVKPDIYIACGISGATQHQVGMKDSKYIIAINKDEDAPIFQISDLGIVGDVHSVLPKLIELI